MNDLTASNANQRNVAQPKSKDRPALNCLEKWMGWDRENSIPVPMWQLPETCRAFNTALDEARAMIPAIRAEVRAAEEDARPAKAAEILTELELLESRYHRMDHDSGTAKALARQWVEDLQGIGVPIGHLRARCKAWRMSDNAFAPRSAGQLLGGKDGAWLASYAARLRGAMERIENEAYADVLTADQIEARQAEERQAQIKADAERKAERLVHDARESVNDSTRKLKRAENTRDDAVKRLVDLTALSEGDLTPAMATLYAASIKTAERARDEANAKIEDLRGELIEAEKTLATFGVVGVAA